MQNLLTKLNLYEGQLKVSSEYRGGGGRGLDAMRSPPRVPAKSEGGLPKKVLTSLCLFGTIMGIVHTCMNKY